MSQTPGQTQGQGFLGAPPQSTIGSGGFPPQFGGGNPAWVSRYGGGYAPGAGMPANPYQALGPSPYSWLGNLLGGGPYGGYGPGEAYGGSSGGQRSPYMQGTPHSQAGHLQGLIGRALASPSPSGGQPNITDIVRQVGAMNATPTQGVGQQQLGWGGWGAPQGWSGGMGRSKA